jgi:hypothetical protein
MLMESPQSPGIHKSLGKNNALEHMRTLIYILLAISSFLIFLLVYAPASPVWSLVSQDVSIRVPDLKVFRVGGTIWNGQGEVQYRRFPPSIIDWQLSPGKLLSQTAELHASAVGDGHDLKAQGSYKDGHIELEALSGTIDSDYINEVSEEFGLTFSGELYIRDLTLSSDGQKLNAASGTADWSGGRILLNTSAYPQVLSLPPLKAELHLKDSRLILDVTHDERILIQIALNQEGWAEISIKGRLFELANFPWPLGADPDETALLLEEKIL